MTVISMLYIAIQKTIHRHRTPSLREVHVISGPTARQFLRPGDLWTRNEDDCEDENREKTRYRGSSAEYIR